MLFVLTEFWIHLIAILSIKLYTIQSNQKISILNKNKKNLQDFTPMGNQTLNLIKYFLPHSLHVWITFPSFINSILMQHGQKQVSILSDNLTFGISFTFKSFLS